MDMLKINIGNDIRIDFKIKTPEELGNADMAIKSLRCFLINTSNNKHCIKRFPNEPFPQYYDPTEYTLRDCGFPKYNVLPINGALVDYKGFGVKSKKFNCCDTVLDKYEGMHVYTAFSSLQTKDIHQAFFPRIDQKFLGKYKFIVVVSFFENGWGKCNIHDIAIDFGEIFELVKEGGDTGYIVIKLYDDEVNPGPEQDPDNPELEDVHTYTISADNIAFPQNGGSKTINVFFNHYINGELSDRRPFGDFTYSVDNSNFAVNRLNNNSPIIYVTAENNQSPTTKITHITITPNSNEYNLEPITITISLAAFVASYYGFVMLPNSIVDYDLNNMTKLNSATASDITVTVPYNNAYFAFVSTQKVEKVYFEGLGSVPMTYVGKFDGLHYHYVDSPLSKDYVIRNIKVY